MRFDWSCRFAHRSCTVHKISPFPSLHRGQSESLAAHALQRREECVNSSVQIGRSEERRVGKECRARWSRYHKKKKCEEVEIKVYGRNKKNLHTGSVNHHLNFGTKN